MSDILSMLTNQLGGDTLTKLAGQLGESEEKTKSAIDIALPMIFSSLNRNAKQTEGAEALSSALEKDHDGSILDNIGALVQNPQAFSGASILTHLMGSKLAPIQELVAQKTGMSTTTVGTLFQTLAPMVMGLLGKKQKEQGLDLGGLASMLGGATQNLQQSGAKESLGMFGALMDSDGDGDVDMGDIAKKGLGLLNAFSK